MLAPAFGRVPRPLASVTRFPAHRNRLDSAMLGNLAILASTTTGEVAEPTKMSAAARVALLRSRSARNI